MNQIRPSPSRPDLQDRLELLQASCAPLLDWLHREGASAWAATLPGQIAGGLSPQRYGDLPGWLDLLDQSPRLTPSILDFDQAVNIGCAADLSVTQREQLLQVLQGLAPWRKGPFSLYGIDLDAEWRSNLKWDRIAPKISPLAGRRVLDIGCGNGYYLLRMLGQGATMALGIDPSPRFVVQFALLKRLIAQPLAAHLLPIKAEQLPKQTPLFDSAFSMGVLYHRRDPLEHLREIAGVLHPGGELVLETLIIPDDQGDLLIPEQRYAQMRNVWAVPSIGTLIQWVLASGFVDIEILDISITTTLEQRRTPWMQFQSLGDFLDRADPSKTLEGYPAPRRAALRATWPG